MYKDAVTAMKRAESCLQKNGLDRRAFGWIVAQTLASYCGYSDAACSLGMSQKTGTYYSGNDQQTECGNIITTDLRGKFYLI